MASIQYSGDVSIRNGGYLYDFEGWADGYVSVTRVTPCSDADGPDNVFWIESLTVNIREGEKLDPVLSCCGLTRETLPDGAARRHALIDCHVAYGAYDQNQTLTVQIGAKADPYSSGRERVNVDRIVRAGSSLRRIATQLHKEW